MKLRTAFCVFLTSATVCGVVAKAQDGGTCGLGRIRERVPPHYPEMQRVSLSSGVVTVFANFASDGHVSSSRVISGPAQLRFEAQAYVNGWVAEADAAAQRPCTLTLEYRFDGSQGMCSKQTQVSVRAERVDEQHVVLHLGCDIW